MWGGWGRGKGRKGDLVLNPLHFPHILPFPPSPLHILSRPLISLTLPVSFSRQHLWKQRDLRTKGGKGGDGEGWRGEGGGRVYLFSRFLGSWVPGFLVSSSLSFHLVISSSSCLIPSSPHSLVSPSTRPLTSHLHPQTQSPPPGMQSVAPPNFQAR